MIITQSEIDAICRNIYKNTSKCSPITHLLGEEFGFEILMGPPFIKAPILFLGYQPGNWDLSIEKARSVGYEKDWVVREKSQYATACWPLAKKLKKIFEKENMPLLEQSVGLNAIYVRARNIHEYKKSVSPEDRKLIQNYCLKCNQEIIQLIKPKKMIVIGFGAMDVFGPSTADLLSHDNRCLTKLGSIFDHDTLAVRHLTGARFKTSDYDLTVQRVKKFLEIS